MATCPKCGSTDVSSSKVFSSKGGTHKVHGAWGGAAAGMTLGGPIGAAIGAGIGALLGSAGAEPEYHCNRCGHTW